MKIILKTVFLLSILNFLTVLPSFSVDTVEVKIYVQQVEKNIDNSGIEMMKMIGERQWAMQNETTMKVDYSKEIITAIKQGDYDNAIKLCYIGLDKYEKYVSKTVIGNYYKYIGFSYLQKQNYSKAIENYNIALKYTTNDEYLYYERGFARLKINDFEGAKEDFNKSITLGLEIGSELLNGNKTYNYLNEKQTVLNNENINIIDYFVMPLMNKYGKLALINTNIKKGEYESVLDFYEARIKNGYKLAETYNNRGVYYLEKQDYEYALKDFQESIKINDKLKEPYFNIALTYYSTGQYEQAIQNLDKFFDLQAKSTKNNSVYKYGTSESQSYSNQDKFIDEILKANIELKLQKNNIANAIFDKYKVDKFSEKNKLSLEYLPLLEGKVFELINIDKYKKAINLLESLKTADYYYRGETGLKERGKYFYNFTPEDENFIDYSKGYEVIENAYLLSNIALLEYSLKKQEKAIEHINKAKRLAFNFNNFDLYGQIIKTYNLIKANDKKGVKSK